MPQTTTRPGPDWFTGGYAEESFRRHLNRFAGMPKLNFLQIGAYCGDASVWLMENVLTGEGSTLTDVDTWQGSREDAHDAIDFDAVYQFYQERIPSTVNKYVGDSDSFFRLTHAPFDFIYVDGSHQSDQVLRDAVNAERVLRRGGILAFDDYEWGIGLRDIPKPAINSFLRCYERKIIVLEVGLQVWVRKL